MKVLIDFFLGLLTTLIILASAVLIAILISHAGMRSQ